jgi:hypothetical protein
LLVIVCACVGCGGSARTAEGDVFVEDPVTLEAVRALNVPPEVLVNVERVTHPRGGSGGSCHSAACLILLPVLVVGALLPPEVTQNATVTTAGEPSYIASFDADGAFLVAQTRDGESWREVRALPLERLGRRPIVSTRRVRRGPDGQELSSEAIPIIPQAPLRQAYEVALAAEDDPEARAELLIEALTWLGSEADALVLARLRQPTLQDAERAPVTEWICERVRSDDVRVGTDDTRRAEAARLAGDHGGTDSAFAALRCFYPRAPEGVDAADLVAVIAKPYCEGAHPDTAFSEIHRRRRLDPNVAGWLQPPTLRCDGPRGVLLRALWEGGTAGVDPAVVARAFREDPAGELLHSMQPHYRSGRGPSSEHHGWAAWHLDATARALAIEPADCPAARCDPLAYELARAAPEALTDAMLDALVDHYAALPTVTEGDRRRATLLRVLHQAELDAPRSERLLRRLEGHEARLAPTARPAVATARLLLGQTAAAAESVRGAYAGEAGLDSIRATARYGTDILISEAWRMYFNCTDSELSERVLAARAGRPVTLCARSTAARP